MTSNRNKPSARTGSMNKRADDSLQIDPDIDLLDELGENPQLLWAILTPPIAFNPVFVDIAGSLTAGLMLSVLIELPQLEQWSPLDLEQVMRETRMTAGELRGARQRLREAQLLLERRSGFPAVTQFKVDFGRIKVELIRLARQQQAAQATVIAASGPAARMVDLPACGLH